MGNWEFTVMNLLPIRKICEHFSILGSCHLFLYKVRHSKEERMIDISMTVLNQVNDHDTFRNCNSTQMTERKFNEYFISIRLED